MKLPKKAASFAAAAVLLALVLSLGGWFGQLLHNYAQWQQAGGELGRGAAPSLPSVAPRKIFHGLFSFPYGLYGLGITAGGLFLLCFFVLRIGRNSQGTHDDDRNLTYSPEGTYGTSGFMTEQERSKVLQVADIRHTKGIILGKDGNKVISLPPDTRMNRNVIVYGSSGSMKSRAYVRNRVFQAVVQGESLVITDCKSEIYNDMSEYPHAQLLDPVRSADQKQRLERLVNNMMGCEVDFIVRGMDAASHSVVAIGLITRIIRQNI